MTSVIFALVLCISQYGIASDKSLSGREIEIETSDAVSRHPVEYVHYSTLIQGMLADAGTSESRVKLDHATNTTFNCLMNYFIKPLYNKDNSVTDARGAFRAFKQQCPQIAALDLLIQSSFLKIETIITDTAGNKQRTFISLMASLYADSLQQNPLLLTQDTISYNDLPHELEPLVAGWLLHDAYKDMKPEIIKRPFKFGDILARPVLSNVGSENGFASIWQQVGGSFLQSSALGDLYSYFDFSTSEPFQGRPVQNNIVANDSSQCALSKDGTYMLVVYGDNTSSTIDIYNLLTPRKNDNSSIAPILSKYLAEIPIDDIVTVVFSDMAQTFDIISYSTVTQKNNNIKQLFTHMSISPIAQNLTTKKLSFDAEPNDPRLQCKRMRWHCIHGTLIGIYTEKTNTSVIVYTAGNLRECSFDKTNNQWFYQEEHKKQFLNCSIISILQKSSNISTGNAVLTSVAIQNSFVPDFPQLISNKLNTDNASMQYITSLFDATNLYKYCIQNINDTVAISYPGDQKFIKSLNVLNTKYNNIQFKVLIDALFMNRFHQNPNGWDTDCKNILEPMLLSPEIQKIYNIQQTLETKKTKNLGWLQALRQGKLMRYVKLKWQLFYNEYKKPLRNSLAIIGGIGSAAWYFNTYGIKNWLPSLKTSKSTTVPHITPNGY